MLAPCVVVGLTTLVVGLGSILVEEETATGTEGGAVLLMVVLSRGRALCVLKRGVVEGWRRVLEAMVGLAPTSSFVSAEEVNVGTSPRLEMRCSARVTAERDRL